MGLFRDLVIGTIGGAIGYNLGEKSATEKKTKGLNSDPPLSCIIEDYARAHGVFGRDNNFCRELIRIAETYHDPYKD